MPYALADLLQTLFAGIQRVAGLVRAGRSLGQCRGGGQQDFRRCRLNVRLTTHIQPLLPGHKYSLFLFLEAVLWLLK